MLKQKFLIQFGSNISLKIIGIFSGIIVARLAGPEVLGQVSYGIAYASMFTFITGIWGTPNIKMISEGNSLDKCLGVFIPLKTASIFLYLLVGAGWLLISKFFLGKSFESPIHQQVVWISLIVIALQQTAFFFRTTFEAQTMQVKSNLPVFTKGILFQLGRIIVVLMGFRALGLLTWQLLTSILVLPITFYLAKKLPKSKWDKSIAKSYWGYAKPLVLYVIIGVFIRFGDKLLLKHFSSIEEIGFYGAAFSIGGLILVLGTQIGVIFFPLFSQYIANGDWDKVKDIITQYQEFLLLFVFPFVCFLGIISKPFIILVYGDAYSKSVTPFSLLIFSSYVMLFQLPFANTITGAGKFYWYTFITFFKGVIYFTLLTLFLAPNLLGLGAVGLAAGNLSTNIILTIIYIFLSFKILRKIHFGRIFYLYIYIGIITLSLIFLEQKFTWDTSTTVYVAVGFLLTLYALLIYFKVITQNHKKTFLQLISIGKLKQYIRNELN
jgi:O-antigen/teichoic acid export membrane protein